MTTPDIESVRALERFIAKDGSASLLLTFQGILRSHEEARAALSSPPADDVREALLDAVRGAFSSTFSDAVMAKTSAVMKRIAADILARLSGICEVRLRGTVTDACPVCNWTGPSPQQDTDGVDVHHPTHDPRGTVTEAEESMPVRLLRMFVREHDEGYGPEQVTVEVSDIRHVLRLLDAGEARS